MIKKLAVAAACAALAGQVSAAAVVSGRIRPVLDATGAQTGSTIDFWHFTVGSAGLVTIDLLSWEADSENRVTADGIAEAVDVNGDGRIAFLDTHVHLFRDDGSLDAADHLIENDDAFGDTYGDGSIYGYDSYLSLNLGPGSYVLAVGAYYLPLSDVLAGTGSSTSYPVTCAANGADCNGQPTAEGDYRITFTGDLSVRDASVPEPTPLALLALAGLGLGWRGRGRGSR